jgi:hypothetical protein
MMSSVAGAGPGKLFALALLLVGNDLAAAVASDEEVAACAQASEAYRVTKIASIEGCPIGGGTQGETRSHCPVGVQRVLARLYDSCGGLMMEGGIDWDSEVGAVVKFEVGHCGCAGAARPAPALSLTLLIVTALSLYRLH